MGLKVVVKKDKEVINKQIKSLEYQIAQDNSEKDLEIHQKALKEIILKKTSDDINFIPELEEFKLIQNEKLFIGDSPAFKIVLSDHEDKKLIAKIEKETRESRPDGLYELYASLEINGYCVTYAEDRMHYVAYTLAEKYINFEIEGLEYKQKLDRKRIAINKLRESL